MFPSRFGMATRPFNLPIKAALRAACKAGARGVFLDARNETPARELTQTAQRDFQHYLGELGLQITAFHFPTRHPIYERDALDQRIGALRQTMDLAARMQVRTLLVDVGSLPSEAGEPDDLAVLAETLSDLAQLGNHIGVTVTVTPAEGDYQHWKTFLDAIQTGPVGVNLDPATCILNQQNPAELVRTFHDRLTHVLARDASRTREGIGVETAVGRGEVCWEEVLAVLAETGYQDWVVLQRNRGDNRTAEMANGIKYLQNIGMES